jgi:pimeloyl-ACP methyl ester carboxylesterase
VEATPLVLLPGMGCSDRLWASVQAKLPDARVITAAIEHGDLDTCVAALLDQLPERFVLAGLSLGGIVAMALVRQAPERVKGLCLASTNPHAPTGAQHLGWAAQLAALDAGRSARDLQAELMPLLVRPAAAASLVDEVLAMADEVGEYRLACQLRLQGTRVDERPGLSEVRVPTLVLAAGSDALCPVARHEEMHALVPGSRLVVLPDTGHLSPMERPAEVADALTGWLVDVQAAAHG